MASFAFAVFIVLCSTLQLTEGANILVVPVPLRSQFNLGIQAGNALKQRGHDVWLMGPEGKQESFAQTGLHYLAYDTSPLYNLEEAINENVKSGVDGSRPKSISVLNFVGDMMSANQAACKSTLENTALINTIRDQKFDLAVMGTTFLLGCLYLIPYKLDIPYVTFEALDESWLAGVSAMPSFQPHVASDPPLTHDMTFFERVRNTVYYIAQPIVVRTIGEGDYQSSFAPEKLKKSVLQLRSDSLMWFIVFDNTCLDYPRISAPHYKFIGALATATPKPLTGELKSFVDGATHGLILVTFGSTKIGATVLDVLLPMFRQVSPKLKQRVLIQFTGSSKDKSEGFSSNVLLQNWIPQNDILGHANTVAMVSHAGANGQMESVFHGVPTICIPIQQEQRYNCRRAVEHKFAVSLSLDDLTADGLLAAITNITTEPSFKNHVTKCSRIVHSLPQGKDQLQFWVDHVLEFGADHLRPKSADMPFYSLFMLDVMAFCVVVVAAAIAVFFGIICCFWRCIRRGFKVKRE